MAAGSGHRQLPHDHSCGQWQRRQAALCDAVAHAARDPESLLGDRTTPPLAISGRGGEKPLDRRVLNVACAVAVEAAGLKKCATVHALRHYSESRIMPSDSSMSAIDWQFPSEFARHNLSSPKFGPPTARVLSNDRCMC